jgi:adenylosuccinate synthase
MKMSKTSIVTGLFFGDEGKGITTAFLSSPQSLVVRFSGGHNAGHTVETNGYRHIFSSFGAGTFRGAHTYWSEYCTFCPRSFFNEQYRPLLLQKLQQIATWYSADNVDEKIEAFLWYVDQSNISIKTLTEIKGRYEHIIFEGAQGIMLDMDFGFFPNVTRSNTTSKNAMDIIQKEHLPLPEIYYVMRAYLTRHGNGYMPNETADLCFEDKTNKTHPYQGKFRQGYHATDLLQHAFHIDGVYTGNEVSRKKLVITCVDQTGDMIYIDNKQVPLFDFLETPLPVSEFLINRSPQTGALEPVKASAIH